MMCQVPQCQVSNSILSLVKGSSDFPMQFLFLSVVNLFIVITNSLTVFNDKYKRKDKKLGLFGKIFAGILVLSVY